MLLVSHSDFPESFNVNFTQAAPAKLPASAAAKAPVSQNGAHAPVLDGKLTNEPGRACC